MRPALGIVAALALAACQVDVDGAGCRDTADCPSGQACGNDGRCSARALACAATRCTPGAAHCIDALVIEQCTEADPACGTWVQISCADRQLVCGQRPDRQAACECPPYDGAELAAGAGGSLEQGEPPYPNGLAAPAGCRFGRLGDALAAAKAHAEVATPATVRLHGDAGADVVFGAATGETFPLEVPAGVTLVGAKAPAGASIVRADGGSSALAVAGAVERLRVESEGAVGKGIAISCGSAATPSLTDVTVSVVGGGTLGTGIDVDGECGAALAGVEVSGAAGPALSVDANGVPVTVARSRFGESGTGIRVTGGKVTVGSDDPAGAVEVSGNFGDGIVLDGGNGVATLDVSIQGTMIAGNGGTGLVLDRAKNDSRLAVSRTAVYANGHATPRSYGPAGARSIVGGIWIRQGSLSPPFVFQENRMSSNEGDQLAVESSSPWSISPGACANANVFGCVGSGYAVGVAGGGTVDASFTVWPDVDASYVSAGVINSHLYCNGAEGAPAPPATCPSP